MLTWNFRWLAANLVLLGVLVEINTAYRQAVGISEIAMPTVRVIRIPSAFRDTITENPMVREFDQMSMTSGMVVSYGEGW